MLVVVLMVMVWGLWTFGMLCDALWSCGRLRIIAGPAKTFHERDVRVRVGSVHGRKQRDRDTGQTTHRDAPPIRFAQL